MTEKPGSLSMKFKLIMNQSNRIIHNIQAGFVALFIFVSSSVIQRQMHCRYQAYFRQYGVAKKCRCTALGKVFCRS